MQEITTSYILWEILYAPPLHFIANSHKLDLMTNASLHNDIIIIGAGPVGLSFALALKETDLRITLIEKQSKASLQAPAYDGRETALTHHSKSVLEQMDVWQRFDPNYPALIKDAKVMDGNSPYALHFSHQASGHETLGYLVSNHAIRKALYSAVSECNNISILDDTTVTDMTTHFDMGYVTLDSGETLSAPLIIAADTRFSPSRDLMGIKRKMHNYQRMAILTTMSHDYSHNETAYEYFRYGNTMAVLPMQNNESSIVLTMKQEDAQRVLAMSCDEFTHYVEEQLQHSLGNMTIQSEHFTYPLVGVYSDRFVAHRFALMGDAAVGMHPVTAHGFNLGLSGADFLAGKISNALRQGDDFAAREILESYNKHHMKECAPLYYGTHTIVKLFTNDAIAPKMLRKTMLHLGSGLPFAKKAISRKLTDIKAA